MSTIQLIHGDCLAVLPTIADGSVDAVVTDPPYGLTPGKLRVGFEYCLRHVFLDVLLPNLRNSDSKTAKEIEFSLVPNDGLPLHFVDRGGVDAGVGVPVRAVDLKGRPEWRKPEVGDAAKSAAIGAEGMLPDVSDAETVEFGGDFVLDLRDDVPLSFCKGACGCYRQLGPGRVAFPVIITLAAGGDSLLGTDFPSLTSGLADLVWGRNDSLAQPGAPARVVAGAGAELGAMLTLDVGRRTFHLSPAEGACNPRFSLKLRRTETVGTLAGAGGLPAISEANRVGKVGLLAHGTLTIDHKITSFLKAIVPDKGFMGKDWDGTSIAFSEDFWREVYRVMKPGSVLLAFGGTRTYHHIAAAIENAGFQVEDSINWVYGQGFPKHKSKLKPAHEPIVLARKPGGAKWLNVDGCRVNVGNEIAVGPASYSTSKHEGYRRPWHDAPESRLEDERKQKRATEKRQSLGRWPANLVLSHSPDCNGTCADDCPIRLMGEQGGERHAYCSNAETAQAASNKEFVNTARNAYELQKSEGKPFMRGQMYSDSGTAARFFPNFDADPFLYQAKASRKDRGEGNTHPTVKPNGLMRWLCRLATPPDGVILDPFMGSGSTGRAAIDEGFSFVGIERDAEYHAIAESRIAAAIPLTGSTAVPATTTTSRPGSVV